MPEKKQKIFPRRDLKVAPRGRTNKSCHYQFPCLEGFSVQDIWPFYRRRLPHIQPDGATFFTTFRLAGSLPWDVIARLKREKLGEEARIRGIQVEKLCRTRLANLQKRYFGKLNTSMGSDHAK
jgi:hypothetical protein